MFPLGTRSITKKLTLWLPIDDFRLMLNRNINQISKLVKLALYPKMGCLSLFRYFKWFFVHMSKFAIGTFPHLKFDTGRAFNPGNFSKQLQKLPKFKKAQSNRISRNWIEGEVDEWDFRSPAVNLIKVSNHVARVGFMQFCLLPSVINRVFRDLLKYLLSRSDKVFEFFLSPKAHAVRPLKLPYFDKNWSNFVLAIKTR